MIRFEQVLLHPGRQRLRVADMDQWRLQLMGVVIKGHSLVAAFVCLGMFTILTQSASDEQSVARPDSFGDGY